MSTVPRISRLYTMRFRRGLVLVAGAPFMAGALVAGLGNARTEVAGPWHLAVLVLLASPTVLFQWRYAVVTRAAAMAFIATLVLGTTLTVLVAYGAAIFGVVVVISGMALEHCSAYSDVVNLVPLSGFAPGARRAWTWFDRRDEGDKR